jgi:hypothetical protein
VNTFAPLSIPLYECEMYMTCVLGAVIVASFPLSVFTYHLIHYSIMIALPTIFWALLLLVTGVHGVAIPNE